MSTCSPRRRATRKVSGPWMNSTKYGASMTRNFQHFDQSATMWKIFSLLWLILFTIDFPPDGFTSAEPIRVDTGLLFHSEEYQAEIEGGSTSGAQQRVFHDDGSSSEFAGKWRNNGEALEPKWRDGDTVPLFPFSQFSQYSNDQLESREDSSTDQKQRQRIRDRVPRPEAYKNYDSLEGRYDYNRQNEDYYRRRHSNRRFEDRNRSSPQLKEITPTRYREAFQVRPNEYEQELDDEEYLKPRPRKRRPPQNYEFALAANEASLRNKNAENASKFRENASENVETQLKINDQSRTSQNSVELKSLLKMQQEEGLSLSELLQRRNLTLDDLLKGRADVISALKMKDFGEHDEYIDSMPAVGPNSFMELPTSSIILPTTVKSFWETTNSHFDEVPTLKNMFESEQSTVQSSIQPLYNNSTNTGTSQSSTTREMEYTTTSEPIIFTFRTAEENPTTLINSSTMMVTPATDKQLLLESEERIEASDKREKLDENRERKSDIPDEDEIMEFSDFPDFLKGRNSGSPIWIAVTDEGNMKSNKTVQDTIGDTLSTLSIEHILSPTEHTKPNDRASTKMNEMSEFNISVISGNKPTRNEDEPKLNVDATESDSTLNHEYQDDAGIMSHGFDEEVNIDKTSQKNSSDLKQKSSGKDEESFVNHKTNTKDMRYEDIVSEVEPEARAEIFELFASSSAGKRLERLLKSRNMSVEELIALRQRGSSKVHLAEVSRLKMQQPNSESQFSGRSNIETTLTSSLNQYKEKTETTSMSTSPTETMRHANKEIEKILSDASMKGKFKSEILTNPLEPNSNSQTDKELINVEDIENNNETAKQVKEKLPHRMVEIVDLLTTFASLPFSKDLQNGFDSGLIETADELERNLTLIKNETNIKIVDTNSLTNNNSAGGFKTEYLEEVVKEEPNSIDVHTVFLETKNPKNDETNKGDERQNLSRVKPSIIASGAILGVTIIVFLAIFIICRVKQKQKYRYRNTFSRAVFQGPMMAARKLSNSSSLSNVMVNVIATSTTKRPERYETPNNTVDTDPKSDIDSDSLDANDSWETIPDYMK